MSKPIFFINYFALSKLAHMKTLCLLIISLFSFTLLATQKKHIKPQGTATDLIPYRKKNNTYIYVNKDKQPVFETEFASADLFTTTGFSVVINSENKQAIIDSNGKIVIPFKDYQIKLYPIGNLTLVKTEKPYTANHCFWEWKFNIFSSNISDIIRIKTDIFILESQQHLLSTRRNQDNDSTYVKVINDNSFLIDNDYYQIINNKAKKRYNNIILSFESNKLLQQNNNSYSILTVKNKTINSKETQLVASSEISFKIGNDTTIIPNTNKSRYGNDIPEVLYNKKDNSYLIQPLFDKKFPQEIIPKNKEDIAFLKKIGYINSIPNYPYFIAGVFDYDKWQYQWKYIDLDGQVYDTIDAKDFFTLDILSNVLRPYKSEIIPSDNVPMYNLTTNSFISPAIYNYINSAGWTNITKDNTRIYFYTDITTGEEYRDQD